MTFSSACSLCDLSFNYLILLNNCNIKFFKNKNNIQTKFYKSFEQAQKCIKKSIECMSSQYPCLFPSRNIGHIKVFGLLYTCDLYAVAPKIWRFLISNYYIYIYVIKHRHDFPLKTFALPFALTPLHLSKQPLILSYAQSYSFLMLPLKKTKTKKH